MDVKKEIDRFFDTTEEHRQRMKAKVITEEAFENNQRVLRLQLARICPEAYYSLCDARDYLFRKSDQVGSRARAPNWCRRRFRLVTHLMAELREKTGLVSAVRERVALKTSIEELA